MRGFTQGRVVCALLALGSIGIAAVGAAPASAADCANEAIRAEQRSAFLPECRAYEMVSPPQKGGNDVAPATNTVRAAEAGNAATWLSFGSFGETEGTGVFSNYLSSRGAGGWGTAGISPPSDPAPLLASGITGFSSDLSTAFVNNGTPLTPEAEPETINLYSRDNATRAYTLLSPNTSGTPFEPDPFGFRAAFFIDVAPKAERVVFRSTANYLPEATGANSKMYASDNGVVSLVGVLPGGEPAPVAKRPGFIGSISMDHTMSEDGSRVAFTVPAEEFTFDEVGGQLYLRDGSQTLHLTESQRSPEDPAGPQPAMFWTMTADGSQAFFTSFEKLTDDSTACGEECGSIGPNGSRAYNKYAAELYRYDVGTEELTDLTVHPGGAQVLGVLGATADGSRIYFAANADLAPGGIDGEINLYSWHEGTITLVTVLTGGDYGVASTRDNWDNFQTLPVARLSDDGERLLFRSQDSLPGFDNGGAPQFYLYDAASGAIDCVSCPPSGIAGGIAKTEIEVDGTNNVGEYMPRSLSADGESVFFSSPDALVAGDTNGRYDAYAYDAGDGSVQLISSGRSETASYFADASRDGGEVLFLTREKLLPQDRDANLDVYAARVGGGFPGQAGGGAGPACQGDECQGPPNPAPVPVRPGSTAVDFGGNQKPKRQKPKKAKKKQKAKCGKKAGKSATKGCGKKKGGRR